MTVQTLYLLQKVAKKGDINDIMVADPSLHNDYLSVYIESLVTMNCGFGFWCSLLNNKVLMYCVAKTCDTTVFLMSIVSMKFKNISLQLKMASFL